MTLNELTLKFITQPANLEMGAGKLAARFKVSNEEIYAAKKEARRLLGLAALAEDQVTLNPPISPGTRLVSCETTAEGKTQKFESVRPLTPAQIAELVGVDGITSTISRVWDKLQTNGIWTYSVDIRFIAKDFYNSDELKERLAELMPNITPEYTPEVQGASAEALIILLADDHVGAVNTTDLFNSSKYSYDDRLALVVTEALRLGKKFEEVHVISLGDQLNGFNSQTTRGGHEVKSLSNKDQFDQYTSARINFYNNLFSSGLSSSYAVHDVDNSNHSGLGFSYMANQFLDMYLQAKFPDVQRRSYLSAIDGFEYGQHIVLFGHGKDEKYQTRPMPAVLNAQTDLFLMSFLNSRAYTPRVNSTTFYKGDLHQLGFQMGKFGRYVNVPAVSGASDYGDINFGGTKGGALLEILDKNSYRIQSQPIWF